MGRRKCNLGIKGSGNEDRNPRGNKDSIGIRGRERGRDIGELKRERGKHGRSLKGGVKITKKLGGERGAES